jgi:hypothetical protein
MNLAELTLRPGRDPARAGRNAFLTAGGPVHNAELQRQVFAVVKGRQGQPLATGLFCE